MRKVMVSRLEQNSDVPNKRWELVEKGEAVFHQFGCDYEEFESGAGNFSTAIVEWPDGKVENVPVENVRFLDAFAAPPINTIPQRDHTMSQNTSRLPTPLGWSDTDWLKRLQEWKER